MNLKSLRDGSLAAGVAFAGCALIIAVLLFVIAFDAAIAYGIYWVCINWFVLPELWAKGIAIISFVVMIFAGGNGYSRSSN